MDWVFLSLFTLTSQFTPNKLLFMLPKRKMTDFLCTWKDSPETEYVEQRNKTFQKVWIQSDIIPNKKIWRRCLIFMNIADFLFLKKLKSDLAFQAISKAGKLLFISKACLLPLQDPPAVEAQDLCSAGSALVNRRLTCVFALLPCGLL